MLDQTVIVLDFEATGLDADHGDRVTEVAALRLEGEHIVERFQTLVNTHTRTPSHIAKFTGITQTMIDAAPDVTQVFPDLIDFIGNDPVIAHNAAFDESLMAHECERLGLRRYPRDFICSVRIARSLLPDLRTHALGALACKLGLEFTPGAHRAGADAQVTAAVILEMSKMLRAHYPGAFLTANALRRIAAGQEIAEARVYSAA